jgi:hypothetical protein
MASTTSSSPLTTSTAIGNAQSSEGISLVALLTAIATSAVIFGVQMLAFIIFKDKLARIL